MALPTLIALLLRAGVVGLAAARALAEQGREVVVLESADAIGTSTSSRNSEVIHAGGQSSSISTSPCVSEILKERPSEQLRESHTGMHVWQASTIHREA